MSMAGIDIVFMVIIAVSSLRCAVGGGISVLWSRAALIFGMLAALLFFRGGAFLVREWFMPGMKTVPEIIAFIALFLIVYIIVKTIEITLKKIIEGIQMGGLGPLLGFILGFVEGVIIVCLFLFFISVQPFFDSGVIYERSFVAKMLLPLIIGGKKELTESVVLLMGGGGGGISV
jgi:membrane protein required for colicin V production